MEVVGESGSAALSHSHGVVAVFSQGRILKLLMLVLF